VPGTLEAAPPAPTEPTSRSPLRRRLVGGVVLTLVCVLGWTSSSSLGGSPLHSTNMVENLDQEVLAEEGVQAALGDLHGHLNSVLWDDGRLDERGWLHLLGAVVARLESDGLPAVAEPLREAAAALRDGGTYQAHNWVELAEFRHANAQREP
jgi:hypothetical protein